MDLHYLRIFYEVAKEKSFTKAANNLYINQSAVSIQVKKFESILNVKLFDRSSKKIKLTYAGEVLFKTAIDIFQKVKRAEKEMEKIVLYEKGKIIIGATHVIGEPLLPMILKEFLSKFKEIEVEVYIKERDVLLEWLREGKVDIALMGDFYIKDKSLEVIPINDYPFVLVNKEKVENFKEMEDLVLINRNDSLLLEKDIEYFEKEYGVSIENRMVVNGSVETVKSLVKEGMGFCILPYFCVHEELANGELQLLLDFKSFKDGYQAVIAMDKIENVELKKFIKFLKIFKIKNEL